MKKILKRKKWWFHEQHGYGVLCNNSVLFNPGITELEYRIKDKGNYLVNRKTALDSVLEFFTIKGVSVGFIPAKVLIPKDKPVRIKKIQYIEQPLFS